MEEIQAGNYCKSQTKSETLGKIVQLILFGFVTAIVFLGIQFAAELWSADPDIDIDLSAQHSRSSRSPSEMSELSRARSCSEYVEARYEIRYQDLQFIHIGKTGGQTVVETLSQYGIQFQHTHRFHPPRFNASKQYIISIRNPIDRFISAFYWRKYILYDWKHWKQENLGSNPKKSIPLISNPRSNEEERTTLKTYQTVNDFAEDLYYPNGTRKIRFHSDKSAPKPGYTWIEHIYEDIDWYLTDFLQKYREWKKTRVHQNSSVSELESSSIIVGVMLAETLAEDMKKLFHIDLKMHVHHYDMKMNTTLSEKGRENIRHAIAKDYQCVEDLYSLGFLTQQQYQILSA